MRSIRTRRAAAPEPPKAATPPAAPTVQEAATPIPAPAFYGELPPLLNPFTLTFAEPKNVGVARGVTEIKIGCRRVSFHPVDKHCRIRIGKKEAALSLDDVKRLRDALSSIVGDMEALGKKDKEQAGA